MVDPPPHVNPPPVVPPSVSLLSSSFPVSSAPNPRSDSSAPSSSSQRPAASISATFSSDFPPPCPPPPSRSSAANPSSSSRTHPSPIYPSSSLFPAPSSAPALVAAPPLPPLPSSSVAAHISDPFPPLFSSAIRTADQPSDPSPTASTSPPTSFPPSPSPIPSASVPSLPQIRPSSQAPIFPSTSAPLQSSISKDPATSLPQSYAQATRSFKGPGFVRSHASDVESFARIPRTGVNIICGSKEGIPSFSFANSDLHTVEELYSNALVMKFHGGRPSLEASHREIQSWGLEHPFSIGPLSSRAFLLRFQDNKDLIRVLTRPSSILITFSYKIFRWHNLCHLKDDSCYAPVWISLPRLPLQCFIPEFLESVANKIGRFLCFDKATSTLARPSAARMCVELDLRKPPPAFIWVGLFEGLKQPIIYEKMPRFCNSCQVQGHSTVDCPKGHRETPLPPSGTRSVPPRARTQPVRQYASKDMPTLQKLPNPFPPTASTPNPPLNSDPVPTTSLPPLSPSEVAPQLAQAELAIPNPLHAPPNLSSDNPLCPVQPNTPHKSPTPSHSRSKEIHKHKSVAFADPPAQPRDHLEANVAFWEAVNRQVAILEQARLKSASATPNQASTTSAVPDQPSTTRELNSMATPSHPPPPNLHTAPNLSESTDPEPSSAADSQSSPPAIIQDAQDPLDGVNSDMNESYASDGEEPITEPMHLEGHVTDDALLKQPQSSKRNKRHPDQPLKVQLRVRKDPTSTSL